MIDSKCNTIIRLSESTPAEGSFGKIHFFALAGTPTGAFHKLKGRPQNVWIIKPPG